VRAVLAGPCALFPSSLDLSVGLIRDATRRNLLEFRLFYRVVFGRGLELVTSYV